MAKLLRAVHPNAGVRAAYQRRLRKLVDEMQRSTVWWLRAAYRKDEARIIPDFAQDASPARMLQKVLNRLFRYWMRRWSDEAAKIAGDFIHKTQQRTTSSYEQAFRAAEAIKRVEDERRHLGACARQIHQPRHAQGHARQAFPALRGPVRQRGGAQGAAGRTGGMPMRIPGFRP